LVTSIERKALRDKEGQEDAGEKEKRHCREMGRVRPLGLAETKQKRKHNRARRIEDGKMGRPVFPVQLFSLQRTAQILPRQRKRGALSRGVNQRMAYS
jgi:hypothetical protein